MSYHDQWRAISSHIRGLMQAGQLHAQFLAVTSSDNSRRYIRLRRQCQGILDAVGTFRADFAQMLPQPVLDAIDYVEAYSGVITDERGTAEVQQQRVWAALVLLGAFETEVSFLLTDTQEQIRSRSERAFIHLQRQIVADPEFKGKWNAAFEGGEVACEKLGAVHLLQHGIFAFKVDAAGERTDLVFEEPLGDVNDMQSYVDGLVLTEWKKINSADDAEQTFERARNQARSYAAGALAGIELTGYRYAVVVSPQHVEVPHDQTEGGVTYRHINIVVDPLPPSRR